jgi:hypothetical protein
MVFMKKNCFQNSNISSFEAVIDRKRGHWPVSCEREFSSLLREVSAPLQPSSGVFLFCKSDFFPFTKESRSHDTGHSVCTQCTLVTNDLPRHGHIEN